MKCGQMEPTRLSLPFLSVAIWSGVSAKKHGLIEKSINQRFLPEFAEYLVELGVGVIAVRLRGRQLGDVEHDVAEHRHPHPEQREEPRPLRTVELVDDVGEQEGDREGEERREAGHN